MKKKLEYLWMYYKGWLLLPVSIILAIYLGVTMHHGRQVNVVVNVAIVGGNPLNEEKITELENELKQYLGADGEYDTVKIQANIPADGGSVNSRTALTTLVGAEAVDVLVCPEDVYMEYKELGGFAGEVLCIEGNDKAESMLDVSYENIYVGTMINAKHQEAARQVIRYIENEIS